MKMAPCPWKEIFPAPHRVQLHAIGGHWPSATVLCSCGAGGPVACTPRNAIEAWNIVSVAASTLLPHPERKG